MEFLSLRFWLTSCLCGFILNWGTLKEHFSFKEKRCTVDQWTCCGVAGWTMFQRKMQVCPITIVFSKNSTWCFFNFLRLFPFFPPAPEIFLESQDVLSGVKNFVATTAGIVAGGCGVSIVYGGFVWELMDRVYSVCSGLPLMFIVVVVFFLGLSAFRWSNGGFRFIFTPQSRICDFFDQE